MDKIYTFDDLVFSKHSIALAAENIRDTNPSLWNQSSEDFKLQLDAKQAYIQFDNKRAVSVVFGDIFYSNGKDTYEVMELPAGSDPEGYCTSYQVTEIMKQIQAKPEYSDEEG